MTEYIKNHKKSLSLLMILILCYLGSKEMADLNLRGRKQIDVRYLPSSDIAEYLAIGYRPAFADLYWIEGINYFGDQLSRKDRDLKYLSAYTDLIARLDPYFVSFYDWASTAYIYNGMPVTRENVIQSTKYANMGIRKLNEIYRYNSQIILKSAFNYAIETENRLPSVAYFAMAGRAFPELRDNLLLGSVYAFTSGKEALAAELKLEFLGATAFEAQSKEQLQYAYNVISSPKMNLESSQFTRALRLKLETDESVKKVIAARLKESSAQSSKFNQAEYIPLDQRLENTLSIDFERTWIPAELHILISL